MIVILILILVIMMLVGVGPSSESLGLGGAFLVTTGLFCLFHDFVVRAKQNTVRKKDFASHEKQKEREDMGSLSRYQC